MLMNKNDKKYEDILDEKGNIKKEVIDKMVDDIIDKNPLVYERLAKI